VIARETRLSRLLERAAVLPLAPVGADPRIHGTALDSRRVNRGHLFFAIRGFRSNGEDFISQALERGAVAVLAQSQRPDWVADDVAWIRVEQTRAAMGRLAREFWGRPDESLDLVGITGTNGKTSVSYMVEAIAAAAGREAGRIGTVTQSFAGAQRAAARTTPEAPDFYRLLAEMLEVGVDLVAMEVSSHALALSRVAGARFAAAAFLNLGRDHLDFHDDIEDYFQAKAQLFHDLPADRVAILPDDSPWSTRLRDCCAGRVMTFGRSPGAAVRVLDERTALDGTRVTLKTPRGQLALRTSLLGSFTVDNVAAAAACALALELPDEAIVQGLDRLERIPGRMDRIDAGQPFTVLVDYAHTEDALRTLLTWLRAHCSGKLSLVFGCGGDRDQGKRFGMGRAAAELSDRIYLTSDNPRNEDPSEIIAGARRGVESIDGAADRCTSEVDRRAAIGMALRRAEPGDVVVVAGKGHETTQAIGATIADLDDRSVATSALNALGFRGGRHAGT